MKSDGNVDNPDKLTLISVWQWLVKLSYVFLNRREIWKPVVSRIWKPSWRFTCVLCYVFSVLSTGCAIFGPRMWIAKVKVKLLKFNKEFWNRYWGTTQYWKILGRTVFNGLRIIFKNLRNYNLWPLDYFIKYKYVITFKISFLRNLYLSVVKYGTDFILRFIMIPSNWLRKDEHYIWKTTYR